MKPSVKLIFRHELKYLLSEPDAALINMRVRQILKIDPHVGKKDYYTVRSLYFDDYNFKAYHDKLKGVGSRRKYRIRIYNYSDQVIHLECKIKQNKYIRKEVAPLTRRQYEQIMNGETSFLLRTDNDLHRIFYHEYTSNLLRPRVIVDYERRPYIMEAGNVRVTFDHNVRAGMENFDIFNPNLSTAETLKPGTLVMEVKYATFLPNIVRQILSSRASEHVAVSKYVLCCDQTIYRQEV